MNTSTLPDDPVFGLVQVAELIGTNANALRARRHRGTFTLQPVTRVGRTEVFSKAQVLAYIQQDGASKH